MCILESTTYVYAGNKKYTKSSLRECLESQNGIPCVFFTRSDLGEIHVTDIRPKDTSKPSHGVSRSASKKDGEAGRRRGSEKDLRPSSSTRSPYANGVEVSYHTGGKKDRGKENYHRKHAHATHYDGATYTHSSDNAAAAAAASTVKERYNVPKQRKERPYSYHGNEIPNDNDPTPSDTVPSASKEKRSRRKARPAPVIVQEKPTKQPVKVYPSSAPPLSPPLSPGTPSITGTGTAIYTHHIPSPMLGTGPNTHVKAEHDVVTPSKSKKGPQAAVTPIDRQTKPKIVVIEDPRKSLDDNKYTKYYKHTHSQHKRAATDSHIPTSSSWLSPSNSPSKYMMSGALNFSGEGAAARPAPLSTPPVTPDQKQKKESLDADVVSRPSYREGKQAKQAAQYINLREEEGMKMYNDLESRRMEYREDMRRKEREERKQKAQEQEKLSKGRERLSSKGSSEHWTAYDSETEKEIRKERRRLREKREGKQRATYDQAESYALHNDYPPYHSSHTDSFEPSYPGGHQASSTRHDRPAGARYTPHLRSQSHSYPSFVSSGLKAATPVTPLPTTSRLRSRQYSSQENTPSDADLAATEAQMAIERAETERREYKEQWEDAAAAAAASHDYKYAAFNTTQGLSHRGNVTDPYSQHLYGPPPASATAANPKMPTHPFTPIASPKNPMSSVYRVDSGRQGYQHPGSGSGSRPRRLSTRDPHYHGHQGYHQYSQAPHATMATSPPVSPVRSGEHGRYGHGYVSGPGSPLADVMRQKGERVVDQAGAAAAAAEQANIGLGISGGAVGEGGGGGLGRRGTISGDGRSRYWHGKRRL